MVADFWKIVRGWFGKPQQTIWKPVQVQECNCKKCVFYTKRMAVVPSQVHGTIYAVRGYCTKWSTVLYGHKAFCTTFEEKIKNEEYANN